MHVAASTWLAARAACVGRDGCRGATLAAVAHAPAAMASHEPAPPYLHQAPSSMFSRATASSLPSPNRSSQELKLSSNRLGDGGVDALIAACAGGALPTLKILAMRSNEISDARGMGTSKIEPSAASHTMEPPHPHCTHARSHACPSRAIAGSGHPWSVCM